MEEKLLYRYLSKYRTELMGVSILWVLWFHSNLELNFFPMNTVNRFFVFLKSIGYGGVDIFLLLSGMGVYNSLSKNDLSVYIKNRLKRIIPTWWIGYSVITLANIKLFSVSYSPIEIIGGMTLTGFLTQLPNQGNWYVSFIVLLYFVAPIFHSIYKDGKNKSLVCILLVILSLVITVPFWGNSRLIGISRIPIFVIGMYISANRDYLKLNFVSYMVFIVLLIVGSVILIKCLNCETQIRWDYALWWYPFILITPVLSLMLALVFDLVRNLKTVLWLFRICGTSSLEILIVSDFFIYNLGKIIGIDAQNRKFILATIILSIIMGVLLHTVINKMIDIFRNKMKIITY